MFLLGTAWELLSLSLFSLFAVKQKAELGTLSPSNHPLPSAPAAAPSRGSPWGHFSSPASSIPLGKDEGQMMACECERGSWSGVGFFFPLLG